MTSVALHTLRPLWFVAGALVLLLAFQAPTYYFEVDARPHLQFALIIPLGAAALWWVRQPKVNPWPVGPTGFSAALITLAMLFAFDSFLMTGTLVWIVAVLLALLAAIHAWGGWRLVRELWPIWGFMCLMIPPPFGLDVVLIQTLQLWVSQAASYVLDVGRVYHHLEGNVIRLADGQDLFVAEACSGVNSLFATIVVLFFSMLFLRRSWPHMLWLFGLGFCCVLAVNVLRVVGLTWIHHTDQGWGKFVDGEPWHSLFGMACFGLLVLLLRSCDSLLFLIKETTLAFLPASWGAWLAPPPEDMVEEDSSSLPQVVLPPAGPPVGTPLRGAGFCYALGTVALALALLQYWAWATAKPGPGLFADREDPLPELVGELETLLPSNWDGWLLVDSHEADGTEMNTKFSTAWTYRRGLAEMHVFVHRPYPDWHGLQVCYAGSGWDVRNLENGPMPGETVPREVGVEDPYYVSCDLEKEDQGRFVLAFSYFDVNNRTFIEPDIRWQSLTFFERLERAVNRRLARLQNLSAIRRQPMRTACLVVQLRTTRGAEATDKAEAMRVLADGLGKVFGPLLQPSATAVATAGSARHE